MVLGALLLLMQGKGTVAEQSLFLFQNSYVLINGYKSYIIYAVITMKKKKKASSCLSCENYEYDEECGEEVYIPFRGDVAKISGRASEIQYSNIPEVSTEMEMEEALKVFDEDYRQMRHKVLQYVIRQPKAIDGMVKVMQKLRNYMKKLMASYKIG